MQRCSGPRPTLLLCRRSRSLPAAPCPVRPSLGTGGPLCEAGPGPLCTPPPAAVSSPDPTRVSPGRLPPLTTDQACRTSLLPPDGYTEHPPTVCRQDPFQGTALRVPVPAPESRRHTNSQKFWTRASLTCLLHEAVQALRSPAATSWRPWSCLSPSGHCPPGPPSSPPMRSSSAPASPNFPPRPGTGKDEGGRPTSGSCLAASGQRALLSSLPCRGLIPTNSPIPGNRFLSPPIFPRKNNSSFLLTASAASFAGFAFPNSVGHRGFRGCSSFQLLHLFT